MVEKEDKILIIVLTADHCFGKLNEAEEIFNDQSTLSVRLSQPHRYSAGINPVIVAGEGTDQSRLVYVGSGSSDLGIFAMEVERETLGILPLSFIPPALSWEPNPVTDKLIYHVFPPEIRHDGIKRTAFLLSNSGGNPIIVKGEDVDLDIPGEFVVMNTLPGSGSSGGGVIKVVPGLPNQVIGIITAQGLGGGAIKGSYINGDFSLITPLAGYINLVAVAKKALGW
ncbi:hypothetical protein A2960_06390 [Candidatus Gottesmanbacteria bacterium RIFCSPLOWO2_01_FULL_39_12b]|uniref:Serine protease n=1 Tax=Candidatus Gottesmanbacteria bacterium RIFCSPLOWO2_01_FULL_39_12b TaxID=1798388 RepID=A0A1F6ART6_9BACT|nr:MAG: hypothetical protein A2960_06390 [Candidatus Gottesmanbacteria bacterium RIFCSPLOWO2_01_FULL_39_12b]